MPIVRLPSVRETFHPPARGPVLLLSCMDLRLIDEIVEFMDNDGLTNRYDHVIFAGSALGALGAPGAPEDMNHWKKTFENHLAIAHQLHHIQDVYIMEHRDCGAYAAFLGEEGKFTDDQAAEEELCHRKYTDMLAASIDEWADKAGVPRLRVKSFLMDLRGEVKYLGPKIEADQRMAKSQAKTKKNKKA